MLTRPTVEVTQITLLERFVDVFPVPLELIVGSRSWCSSTTDLGKKWR